VTGPFSVDDPVGLMSADMLTATTTTFTARDSDAVNAADFVTMFGDDVLWTPEQGWMIFDGLRWVADIKQLRTSLMTRMCQSMLLRSTVAQNDDERNTLRARVRRLESTNGLSSAFKYAEHLVARSIVDMDKDPYALNCPSGTIDLRTGEKHPHNPKDFITRFCPTPLDMNAVDEVWNKVLYEAFGGDEAKMRFFQRFIGYSLTGDYSMKSFMALYGPSNAGKSTLVEPLHIVLGDVDEGGYVTTWDADVIQADAKVNRSEKMDKARSARLILVGELEKGKHLADGFVKRFTGGNAIDARALYKGSYTFRPGAKLLLDTNYVPRSADPAVHTRLKLLPATHVPKIKDPEIKRHLEEDSAAHAAILAWAVRGCVEWWQARSLGETPWLAEAMSKFVKSSDALVNFREDCFVETDVMAECVHVSVAWAMYTAWVLGEGGKPMQKRSFMDAMEERGHMKHRLPMGGATILTGLRSRPIDDLDTNIRAAVLSGTWTYKN
jgi:putative DNA primase/helicase